MHTSFMSKAIAKKVELSLPSSTPFADILPPEKTKPAQAIHSATLLNIIEDVNKPHSTRQISWATYGLSLT